MSRKQKKLPKSIDSVHLRIGGHTNFSINEETKLTVYVTSCFKIVDHLLRELLSPGVSCKDPAVKVIAIDSKLRNPNSSILISGGYVVLCVSSSICLVVRVRGEKCLDWLKRYLLCMAPHGAAASLKKLLKRDVRVCLVGAKDPNVYCRGIGRDVGVKLGHLAARIRMKPELYLCENLKMLAMEVLGENSYDDSVVNGGHVGGGGQTAINQPEPQLQPQSGQAPIDQSEPEPQSGQAIVNQPESERERAARYWEGQVFSEAELKALVYDSYISYKIGEKLLALRVDKR